MYKRQEPDCPWSTRHSREQPRHPRDERRVVVVAEGGVSRPLRVVRLRIRQACRRGDDPVQCQSPCDEQSGSFPHVDGKSARRRSGPASAPGVCLSRSIGSFVEMFMGVLGKARPEGTRHRPFERVCLLRASLGAWRCYGVRCVGATGRLARPVTLQQKSCFAIRPYAPSKRARTARLLGARRIATRSAPSRICLLYTSRCV